MLRMTYLFLSFPASLWFDILIPFVELRIHEMKRGQKSVGWLGYVLQEQRIIVRFLTVKIILLFCLQLTIQSVPWALPPGTGGLEREDDQSLPSNTYIKNEWSWTFEPPHTFITCFLIIHPSMALQPLPGLGLPHKTPPFISIRSSSPPFSYPQQL